METVIHPLKPLETPDARVLVLGTMPSPKSRAQHFYYAHPQNRFWRVMAQVLGETLPADTAGKAQMLCRHRIALWDVLYSCEITGASDASIRNPVPNPIETLLARTQVHSVFTTGKTAYRLYEKLVYPKTQLHAVALPSPSHANCRVPFAQLVEAYRAVAQAASQ